MWQGDPSLGQPAGLLQLLRAIPPELPAQRVADPGGLTVQRQPGAARRRRAGGGRGRRRHRLPGVHVALLALVLPQPLLAVSPLPPPAPPVEACRGKLLQTVSVRSEAPTCCLDLCCHPDLVGTGSSPGDKRLWDSAHPPTQNPNPKPPVAFMILPANGSKASSLPDKVFPHYGKLSYSRFRFYHQLVGKWC